jgi:1-deoxy-D-xylulose-5-phosphate reductoisomerase
MEHHNTNRTRSGSDKIVKKNVIILGSTGSIGKSALDVCRSHPDFFRVKALSCNNSTDELRSQVSEFGPEFVSIADEAAARSADFRGCRLMAGEKGLLDMIAECDADIVVNGISGANGLLPSVASLESGKSIALANKETIVMAGSLVKKIAAAHGAEIIPVDSEHSGLFQLIGSIGRDRITELCITASGGAVRDVAIGDLWRLTPEDVLKHPTWSMGKKITIDSATGANKALELIEAHHLFDMPASAIKVLIHPQSLVHAMVRTCEGYLFMQVSEPDMRLAIHSALFHPNVHTASYAPLDLAGKDLRFASVDEKKYRMIGLGYEALESGDSYAIVLNAANEIAVAGFLKQSIRFTDIADTVERTLALEWQNSIASIGDVIDLDRLARVRAGEILSGIIKGRI